MQELPSKQVLSAKGRKQTEDEPTGLSLSKPPELKGKSGLQVAGKDQGGPDLLAVWEGFLEEDVPAGAARVRQAWRTRQWLAVSSLTLSLSTSRFPFFFSMGEWVAGREGGDREKHKTPGRQFTSDLRQGKYLLAHSRTWLWGAPPAGDAWVYAGVWSRCEASGGQCLANGIESSPTACLSASSTDSIRRPWKK